MSALKDALLKAPDSQLDHSMFPLIEKWADRPKAIEILEVLDHCVHGGLASGTVVSLLEACLEVALLEENISREVLLKEAVWRKD